jgi:hypothetical protein
MIQAAVIHNIFLMMVLLMRNVLTVFGVAKMVPKIIKRAETE